MILCCDKFSVRAATFTSVDEVGQSPLTKRAKPTYLAMDKENQIIGYVVPIFRGRYDPWMVIMKGEINGMVL